MEDRYIILTENAYNLIMEYLVERPLKEVANIVSMVSKDVVDNREMFVLNLKEQELETGQEPDSTTPEDLEGEEDTESTENQKTVG